jgi:KDO2-lipid IV(A) lauroyltransferase
MGSKLLYHLIILPISRLPFSILYALSDFTYLILYKLIGYRTKVVRGNLERSFPEKSEAEIKQIESKFYHHLCDLMVESIKAFTISKEEAKKRIVHRNPELINQFYDQGKQVVLAGGHYGNWELFAITIGMEMKHKSIALFTPLKDKFMNEKITNSRSKYGLEMLAINAIKNRLKNAENELFTIIFGTDQSPRKSQKSYWMKFLNQETGVQFGTEKFAKEYKAAVVFGNIYKVKRGYYEFEYELICEEANQTEYGFITQSHVRKLEKVIRNKPEFWLWSHKRWKHKRPDGMILNEDLNI